MSAQPKLLVTTAIEQSWGTDEPIVFLGEWCRRYLRRDVWSAREHTVVPNHWDDRSKLRDDYYYLRGLRDEILADLTDRLNEFHRVDRSERYWHMLLGPWLVSYVAIIWDRWECVRVAFESNDSLETIALQSAPYRTHLGYSDFADDTVDHAWNHELILDLIRHTNGNRCVVRNTDVPRRPIPTALARGRRATARAVAKRIAGQFDRVLGKVTPDNRVLFYTSYFPAAALVKLNLRLKQIPRLYLSEFDWPTSADQPSGPPANVERQTLQLSRSPRSAFEEYLGRRVARDIPWVHVEGYAALRERSNALPMQPAAIFTANAHWGNELFKVWSAERVRLGTKLITMEHGGAFHMAFDSMDFEEKISEVKTVWRISSHPKNKQLPPNKLAGVKPVKSRARKYLAVTGYEMPAYAYRAQASPIGAQTLAGLEMICEMFAGLSQEVRMSFRVKPYPERGWTTRQRFVDRLGSDHVSNERNYLRFLSTARLSVSTYPQTTFSEAIASGVPSLLVYTPHLWETVPELNGLLTSLREAKIVFHDPGAAARHINQIWDAPDEWWNRSDVLSARRNFHQLALDLEKHWVEQWATFINHVIA